MVKEFTYHGLSKEELSNIPNEKLLKLFTARTNYRKKAFAEFKTVDDARDLASKLGVL